jgi:hypothetical protein
MLVHTGIMSKIRIPPVTIHGAAWNFADFHPESGSSYYESLCYTGYKTFSFIHFVLLGR